MATRWQVQAAYPRGAPHFRSSIAVQPPDGRERHLLGVPFIDQIFHGAHFLAPPPQAQDAGFEWLSSVELLLLIVLLLMMIRSNVIAPITVPFLAMMLPLFNDGAGHLSFFNGMRGALPEFRRGMVPWGTDDALVARHPLTTAPVTAPSESEPPEGEGN